MKKILILLLLSCFICHSHAQVTYYKGEWTKINMHELFTCIIKLEIDNKEHVKGEFLWKFLAIDSSSTSMMDYYKRKKGKTGIEYVDGNYNRSTHDVYVEGKYKDDPFEILGLDKYNLKLSADKKVIYGRTSTGGSNEGLLYAVKMDAAIAQKEMKAAKDQLKKN